MKKVSRRNFLKVSGAMAAAGALAACGGSGASTPAASGAASTSTAASAAAAGEDKFASLGDFTMTVGHAQPEGNPRFVSMEQFAADVAEATNGHVKIEVTATASWAPRRRCWSRSWPAPCRACAAVSSTSAPSADVHPALPDQHPCAGHGSAAERSGTEGVR